MSARRRARLGALCLLAVGAGTALGYVPLRHPGTGAPLFWKNAGSVSIVFSSHGSDDLAPGEHEPALRMAVEAWNQVPGSFARLVENTDPLQQARTDWQADDVHLVLFDEDNSSGYFPAGSSTVAITPVWFVSNGRIVDADILFNGSGYAFDTQPNHARFDVQDVAVHELGHMLGFDHSPIAGSSLFPYVTHGLVLHRSLAADDHMAARVRYPQATHARVKGRVVRDDDSGVVRAHVVLRDGDGRSVGAALANAAGDFVIAGVEPGQVEVLAVPLDGPVTAANLTGAPSVDTDFQATLLAAVEVPASGDVVLGPRVVDANTALSLGRSSDPLPLRATTGATTSFVLRGSGLVPGCTLHAPDPDVAVAVSGWFGNSVAFSVSVPAHEETGHVDLVVVDPAGDRAILPGALEITPPDPVVAGVWPGAASSEGGTLVTLGGSGFRAGACVVVGGEVLRDGDSDGCTVVDDGTITFELGPCPAGVYDVVVVDPSGVEGRAVAGLEIGGEPAIQSVFPPAGSHVGGTEVVLEGAGFDPGLAVTIGGAHQSVTSVAGSRVTFVTQSSVPGGPHMLEVTNPIGAADAADFTFASLPDPRITDVVPGSGSPKGGEWVTITGTDLRADLDVLFGADADTGLGGSSAASTVFVDGTTLRALTPTGSGTASVVLRDPSTLQASALPSAFHYRDEGSGGGCGSLAPVGGGGGEPLRGLWWVALLFVVLGARALHVGRARQGPAVTR